ncbi:MAG: hypothetical protein K0R75_960 [Paenibacillaceae bacterium]|jgi:tetratricopeptide (TPR) repeat protein|nr:hypothetical protein [Paenibacillaceae bacterium]
MEKKKRVSAAPRTKIVPIQMDATFFFERAVQSLDRYHYDKALKYFRRAAEFEPENPVNHCNLAGILSEMGNYSESNAILQKILTDIDYSMTECHFYMANNFANMEDYESAEKALTKYLENDPNGQFLEESEEMMELLSYELERPLSVSYIKSREGLFEHDKARALLEEGKFSEAVRILERLVKKHNDFYAARNNLALAYYYIGQFEKALTTIRDVLSDDPGNLHALCNMAIFQQHTGDPASGKAIASGLSKIYPYHPDHTFKLATTMGILGEHEAAHRLFKRLIKLGEGASDPSLYHFAAAAACNIGRFNEAQRLWRLAEKVDPKSEIPKFYLSQLPAIQAKLSRTTISYHYHLPFEEQFRTMEKSDELIPEQLKRDPLVRSSFFWALRHGDVQTKLQVIQVFGIIADDEVKDALQAFIMEPEEDDYLKKVAIFVLRGLNGDEPLTATLGGKQMELDSSPFTPNLPFWEKKWQLVLEYALCKMQRRFDIVQQHDLETLWVECLSRAFPNVPKVSKVEGWAAALEYLTAKMHRRATSYHEVAVRYGVSIATVSKNAKFIDETCGLKEKMNAIFPKFAQLEP